MSNTKWEFCNTSTPDISREWDYCDEIVKEFWETGYPSLELKLSRQIDADVVADLENAIERAEYGAMVVFDEHYGRAWLERV